jgi:hypothetical protein
VRATVPDQLDDRLGFGLPGLGVGGEDSVADLDVLDRLLGAVGHGDRVSPVKLFRQDSAASLTAVLAPESAVSAATTKRAVVDAVPTWMAATEFGVATATLPMSQHRIRTTLEIALEVRVRRRTVTSA